MCLAIFGELIMTSQAGVRPDPSDFSISLIETIALRTSASCARTCCCWLGGQASMIRSIDCPALFVCRVEKIRWPVSAAVMAVWIVGQSRISPTMITSGSWRIRFFRASGKLGVSVPTSRCETAALPYGKRYSIGSSIVMTWTGRVSITDWMIAASVVDFPEPVGPVMRTNPEGKREKVSMISGRPSSCAFRMLNEIRRKAAASAPR